MRRRGAAVPSDFLTPCCIEDFQFLYQINPDCWRCGRSAQGLSLSKQFSPDRIDSNGSYIMQNLRACCRVFNVMVGARDAEVARFAALTGRVHFYHEQMDTEQRVEYLRSVWRKGLNMDRWKRRRSDEEEQPSEVQHSVSVEKRRRSDQKSWRTRASNRCAQPPVFYAWSGHGLLGIERCAATTCILHCVQYSPT